MSQNYHIVCHNPEFHFHEFLDYKIDYIIKDGKVIKVEGTIVGKSAFVTAETFNGGAAQIYSQFNDENDIIGSMLVFGASAG